MSGFAHDLPSGTTTLSEILNVQLSISADQFFGCFAYATQSGFRIFELSVGEKFWAKTPSRWLFGIDYGRTDPRALREIAKRPNTEVRIFDGKYVVARDGFVPRRDFHPKVAMMENAASGKQGMVLGSGNFSHNGLRRSVEAGSAIIATTKVGFDGHIKPVRTVFEKLWVGACPLIDIAADYGTRLAALINLRDAKNLLKRRLRRRASGSKQGMLPRTVATTSLGIKYLLLMASETSSDLRKPQAAVRPSLVRSPSKLTLANA